ncbi:MAG: hypothetical protein ABIS51_14385 [Sphingomonas sp.]
MLGFAWISLILVSPQQAAAPYGWGCEVEENLVSGVHMGISQTVETPGLNTFPRIVHVERRSLQFTGYGQSLKWTVREPEEALGDPESLSLEIDLKKADWKGAIRLDHDGGSMSLPPIRILSEVHHGKASIFIQDDTALHALWQSSRWQIAVLDRHGAVQYSVESALPRSEDITKAFFRLSSSLARKVAAPEGQCDELSAEAWI